VTPAAGRGARILAVDDEPALREACAALLSLHGHEVAQAGDAVEALELLAAAPCDLVLTDLQDRKSVV
jgi:two-component system response regulator MprA